MNLRDTILAEHSKPHCDRIVKWIGSSQARFNELFSLFLNDEYRVVQRASWPLSYAAIAYPEFMQKHFRALLDNLQKPGLHDAVKRNTVRLMQDTPIPKRFQGRVMDLCFNYIIDPKEKVVVKVYSMIILDKLAKQYPEIKPELRTIIEDRWAHETAAFRSRAKRILKAGF
jgi:hypothetical protein